MKAKKFILVGGYPHKANDNGKTFYESLVKGFEQPVKVLVCLFARPQGNWGKAFLQDKNFFETNLPNIGIEIRLASFENFVEELKWCNSIYFRGGDIDLVNTMSKYPDWQNCLKDKIVAGSSMGAYMLSKYYYDIVENKIKKGTGTTNTKIIVHWKSDLQEYANTKWDEGFKELENYQENLPIYKLAEGQFIEIHNL